MRDGREGRAEPVRPAHGNYRADNRYYGRFYRRGKYESKIAEEYKVRKMLERARRHYEGIEGEIACRGYGDPSSADFATNQYAGGRSRPHYCKSSTPNNRRRFVTSPAMHLVSSRLDRERGGQHAGQKSGRDTLRGRRNRGAARYEESRYHSEISVR